MSSPVSELGEIAREVCEIGKQRIRNGNKDRW